MSPEKDAELCSRYPLLYAQRHMSKHETCMCGGFECGDGWFDIIDRLSAELEAWNHVHLPEERVEALQVKEKFGGLRFYAAGGDDFTYNLIEAACAKSEKTCEVCGAPGEIRKGSWLRCLCDKHAEVAHA